MFTEYHLEKIVQAINDAEERQTKALLEAIRGIIPSKAETGSVAEEKPKPVFRSTPRTKDSAAAYFASIMGTPRKPTAKKKQTEAKK